jgi:hypothetical protein
MNESFPSPTPTPTAWKVVGTVTTTLVGGGAKMNVEAFAICTS